MHSRIGWIGVDLDGTLALTCSNTREIGAPVAPMLSRVHDWLDQGLDVRIVTARVGASGVTLRDGTVDDQDNAERQRALVDAWCVEYIGQSLPITHGKDVMMVELWDDRVIQVERDTGKRVYANARSHIHLFNA